MLDPRDKTDLNDRPIIISVTPNCVKRQAKYNSSTKHSNGPIHIDWSDRQARWEEGKDDRNEEKNNSAYVDDQPELPERPWTPMDRLMCESFDY